jgi:hypothetical protein
MRWGDPSSSAATGKKPKKCCYTCGACICPCKTTRIWNLNFSWDTGSGKKDIIAVTHFADLMPEVLFLDKAHNDMREELIDNRIAIQK